MFGPGASTPTCGTLKRPTVGGKCQPSVARHQMVSFPSRGQETGRALGCAIHSEAVDVKEVLLPLHLLSQLSRLVHLLPFIRFFFFFFIGSEKGDAGSLLGAADPPGFPLTRNDPLLVCTPSEPRTS